MEAPLARENCFGLVPPQQAKFVDGSCEHAGDGLSDDCASAAGQSGRFNDLQVALDSLVAGDTLYVHPGDYFRSGSPHTSRSVQPCRS